MKQDKPERASAQKRDDTTSLIERAAERLSEAQPGDDDPGGTGNGIKSAGETPCGPASEQQSRYLELDLEHLAAAGHLTPNRMRSRLAEEMRLIKRSVVQTFWHQEVDNANLIMVTSAFPGEGKSFSALNLAISLACEVDFYVLLVDADFERPALFDQLGVESRPGLMEVLKDSSRDLSEILWRTNIEHLSVIGPGHADARSSELLASHRMQELAQEMANRYPDRLIIFDTPPLLSTSEPAVLAQHMGQILFVVEADITRREMIDSALERLPADRAVGMILNKGRSWLGSNQYPYYGYRSHRYSNEETGA